MRSRYRKLQNEFTAQVARVFSISEFDYDFMTIAVDQLTELERELRDVQGITNGLLLPTRTIDLLRNVVDKGPQRAKYQQVYNQSVVLLVSYFASVLSDVFNDTLTFYLSNIERLPKKLEKEEFKFTLNELSELNFDLSHEIGRMISRKADISFQDMGSVAKAFKRFFEVEIRRDASVSNIIAAQACRHAIVHNGEVADEKCVAQMTHAKDRSIQPSLVLNDKIAFGVQEIGVIGESMQSYVRDLCDLLLERLSL